MRIAIKSLKVGDKFCMSANGAELEVVSVTADMIIAKGGEAGIKRLAPQERAVWLCSVPKAAAVAPKAEVKAVAPKAEVKAAAPKVEAKAAAPKVEAKAAAPKAEAKSTGKASKTTDI